MQASGRAVASFLPVKGFSRAGFWLLAGAGTALAGFGASQLPLAEWAQVLRGWIEELGVLGFVAFGAAYIAAAVLLIPVWPLSISGGLLFGLWGFVWVPLSATLGAMAAFLISRHMVRDRVRQWLARHPKYQAIDRAVGEEGWKIVALLRISPLVPYNMMNYFCGMTRVPFAAYAAATLVGTIPVTAIYVYLGYMGHAAAGSTMGWPHWALLGLGLVATVAATVLVTRRVRHKLDEAR
jgi:uncharacterized membrane protein YdjX (TVP38/TMEM64 family)